ncbi:response regulator transcription factor [Mucisphaera sp.]|uniref:response regulator transcription factor n=1 Tax=Mucisphaera sp. TaxID=2913024 RepID=UPI003D0C14E3
MPKTIPILVVDDHKLVAEGITSLLDTVTRLVAQGLTSTEIASAVFRSPKTVEKQIASAMEKTNSANRIDLSHWAIREGLVQP